MDALVRPSSNWNPLGRARPSFVFQQAVRLSPNALAHKQVLACLRVEGKSSHSVGIALRVPCVDFHSRPTNVHAVQ